MDPRISTLESDVAAMRANIETIFSNYATNLALAEAEARLRLEIVSSKAELERMIERTAAEQKLEYQQIASDMRNWLLATVIGLFVGFGGLFIGMARILKP